jgi:hypothetical protein
LKNVNNYANHDLLHINNVFVETSALTVIHTFKPQSGFISLTYSRNQTSIPPNYGTREWSIGQDGSGRYYYYCDGFLGAEDIYFINDNNIAADKSLFKSIGSHLLSVDLLAEEFNLSGQPTTNGFITVEFLVGNLAPITKKIEVKNKIQTVEFYYQPNDYDFYTTYGSFFILRKLGPGKLSIYGSSVNQTSVEYDLLLNNNIYLQPTNFTDFSLPSVNDLNRPIINRLGDKTGGIISIKYGNGAFKSGLWKFGVWNDGWRSVWTSSEEDILFFDSVSTETFKVNINKWNLKLVANTNVSNILNIIDVLKPNDFVSIGNVVGIDLNEERYLLTDYYRVVDVETINNGTGVVVTLDIPVSRFPLNRFTIDSEYHLIYVTKNIWLSGRFMNGYYRGVWNFGAVEGYPFTTFFEHSHFISGKFDGGRFRSSTASIFNSDGSVKLYQTGLVQYMDFNDKNVSEFELNTISVNNTYQSWMDLNYYTYSFVNLNSLTTIYDDSFGKNVTLPNLYGYPTYDVLSSTSKFKNTSDQDSDYYTLGTKYQVFTDHLGDLGYFKQAFNSDGRPGLSNFTSKGWTANQANFYGTPTVSFVYASNITRRNFNKLNIVMATFGYNILNNDFIEVPERRYVVIEYDLAYFERGTDPKTLQATNTFLKPINLLGSNYPSNNNIFKTGMVKTEYFYNKTALDMILRFNASLAPPVELLAMYGYNQTYSTYVAPEEPGDGSYYTTYSIVAPTFSFDYLDYGPNFAPDYVDVWSQSVANSGGYMFGDVTREPEQSAIGYYILSLQDNNTQPPGTPQLPNRDYWLRTALGWPQFVDSILAYSDTLPYFTNFRSTYFKFLEIDSLPFFKYFDYEANFISTFAAYTNVIGSTNPYTLGLEFLKPHGFKIDDKIYLTLDETYYNPNYVGEWKVLDVIDGVSRNLDVYYTLITDCPYGSTASIFAETGTIIKLEQDPFGFTVSSIRIDKRIQTNNYAVAPVTVGLNEDYIYLGANDTV